jgi:histidinol phosphatase-like enzyme (inositol monophosphatase family)
MAYEAGALTLKYYGGLVAADAKGDGSPVTIADRKAERVMRELIERRFPHDAIVGEEEGETRSDAARRWIIDPIDGTRTFMRGVPFYGTLLALEADGDVVVGVLHFPALSETVYAARNLGCWWNSRRALVSDVTTLESALVLTTDAENLERIQGPKGWDQLRARAGMCRTWGDCYGYALVATGRAEAMIDPVVSIWDTAALLPVIEEAGGVFSDFGGASGHRGGSAIATNAALAQPVRRLLGNNGT